MKSTKDLLMSVVGRKAVLSIAILFAILLAGRFAPNVEASQSYQATVPPSPALFTVLIGPIDSIDDTVDPALWSVAGVPVYVSGGTRLNERQVAALDSNWARVEGYPDDAGGLVAVRIKAVPQKPFVQLEGLLEELSEGLLKVSGITLVVTDTTVIVGSPEGGERVRVTAAIQDNGSLLALQVRRIGQPHNDDDDDDDDDTSAANQVELIGVVIERPSPGVEGDWLISGIPVSVNEQTEVKEQVGDLLLESWVKIEGSADGDGGIIANKIKAIGTRDYHKLEGVLDSLTEFEVKVNGIVLALDDNVELEGTPTVGRRVEIRARYDANDEKLYALWIEGEDDDDENEGDTRHIAGEIKQLPDGSLFGLWHVGPKTVEVPVGTPIDEHKGLVEEGAQVRVEVLKNSGDVLIAVKVVVLHGAHNGNDDDGDDDDDDDDGEHHRYIEFEDVIKSLPNVGLIGMWEVGDYVVMVTEKTHIEGDTDQIDVDVMVEVEGYLMQNGNVLAREIEIEDPE